MWARSRVINWWAVVSTGAVVILLAVILVVGTLRRKTHSEILRGSAFAQKREFAD
jgi:glucose dehydrogenase